MDDNEIDSVVIPSFSYIPRVSDVKAEISAPVVTTAKGDEPGYRYDEYRYQQSRNVPAGPLQHWKLQDLIAFRENNRLKIDLTEVSPRTMEVLVRESPGRIFASMQGENRFAGVQCFLYYQVSDACRKPEEISK